MPSIDKKAILSSIPSVDELLKHSEIEKLVLSYPRSAVVEGIREFLNLYRKHILSLPPDKITDSIKDDSALISGIAETVHSKMRNKLLHVVNATGVVLHTNLGRAILSPRVAENLWKIAAHYSNLEFDVQSGNRGSRYSHVEELICRLTGAEAAMVVNNNAAAVLLVLSSLAKGKEVIVSRGQLVEIGGSFRVPDVMEQSGARLVEVGTTNKTHAYDYENAINENTAVLMKIHTSNYRILGFTQEVESEEMVSLGKKYNIPVVEDLGSGVLLDLSKYGLPYEPTVQSAVNAGMDVVTFSGDKMLGGPQAGIIIGRKDLIAIMKKNPLTRAFRIDKLTLAALEGTLKLYLDESAAAAEIPVLRMLTEDIKTLNSKAKKLQGKLRRAAGAKCVLTVQDEYSEVGGGSMPIHKLPTRVVAVETDAMSLDELDRRLRGHEVPIITRISRERLLLDARTILEDEYDIIAGAFADIFGAVDGNGHNESGEQS